MRCDFAVWAHDDDRSNQSQDRNKCLPDLIGNPGQRAQAHMFPGVLRNANMIGARQALRKQGHFNKVHLLFSFLVSYT